MKTSVLPETSLFTVLQVDLLVCPTCGGEMKGIAWITARTMVLRDAKPHPRADSVPYASPFPG